MTLYITSNVGSVNARRNLNVSTLKLNKSLEKLSSGFRINRASDDAAGLSIAQGLESVIMGQKKALDNAQDGINMMNISEGALSIVQDNLQRMRELAVQAANGTNGTDERDAISLELTALKANIIQISNATNFNGINLMDGSVGSLRIQAGEGSNQANNTVDVGSSFASAHYSALVTGGTTFGSAGTVTLTTASNGDINNFIATLDAGINLVSARRSLTGAFQNRLEAASSNLALSIENRSASLARIKSVDIAAESAAMTQLQILQQAGATVLSQANQTPSLALSLLRG